METRQKSSDEIRRRRNTKNRFNDALAYVGYWIDRENIIVTAKQEIKGAKRNFIASSLLEKIELDYDVERRAEFEGVKNSPNVAKLLGKALSQHLENVLFEATERLRKHLEFDESLSDRRSLRTWLIAVTGKDDDINLIVISHWLWMVKRNLHGKSIKNHIMPIVYGPQGYGKSQAIIKLLSPLDEFVGLLNLDQMLDPKMAHSLKDLLVVFVDEMRQANKVDVDELKNQITTPSRMGRRAYSPMADHLPNITSLIGATNKHIQDIIRDDTGMRRFFVVDSPARCAWDTINKCDYESVWRSIDENNDSGYLVNDDLDQDGTVDSLSKRQMAYADKHPALQWLEECVVAPFEGCVTEYVSDIEILAEVSNFMERSGITMRLSKNQLTRKVSFLLGPKLDVSSSGTRIKGWYLNKNRDKYSPLPIFTREIKPWIPS